MIGNSHLQGGMPPTLWPPSVELEEYISPQEYLDRMSRGAIDPMRVRPATCDPKTGAPGGFFVRLDEPRIDFMTMPSRLEITANAWR